MELTCINCPVGCRMNAMRENGVVTEVTGNACKRGADYARQECVAPMRMLTAVIPVEGSKIPLSVKTRSPIPKDQLFACMQALATFKVCAPVKSGEIVFSNICGTGVDVIATKSV